MSYSLSYISIFPELFETFLNASLIGKAKQNNLINATCVNPRDYSAPPHHKVDDTPYGGGAGMVMLAEPLCGAIDEAKKNNPESELIILSASGALFTQEIAKELSSKKGLIFVCGRYEGIDQRVAEIYHATEISVGNFVTFGGEIPAMVITEAVVRLLPNVIGNNESLTEESFATQNNSLEAPQYTKPQVFRGLTVPEELVSGDPKKIYAWKEKEKKSRLACKRPDLV